MCYTAYWRDLPPDWCEATVSTLWEVEDMLDQLERRGCAEFEFLVLGERRVTIRWR